jgi:hypothetical protein
MSDIYKNRTKKIVFYENTQLHAQALAKMKVDGVKQRTLFRVFLEAFIADDPAIRELIERHPDVKVRNNRKKRVLREERKAKKQKVELNLDREFIENLFDIIAEENGDL